LGVGSSLKVFDIDPLTGLVAELVTDVAMDAVRRRLKSCGSGERGPCGD
jgi:hypothetical protein